MTNFDPAKHPRKGAGAGNPGHFAPVNHPEQNPTALDRPHSSARATAIGADQEVEAPAPSESAGGTKFAVIRWDGIEASRHDTREEAKEAAIFYTGSHIRKLSGK